MKLRRLVFPVVVALTAALIAPGHPLPASAAGDTIVFGSPVSETGAFSKEGALTIEGDNFWKDWVNSHGGLKIGGKTYKVDIKYYDDETNPQVAAKLAEKLITEDKVNFMLGPYGTPSTFTVAAVADRYKMPMVVGNGAAVRIFSQGYKYVFGVISPAGRYLEGIVDLAIHQKPRAQSLAISAANDAFSLEAQQGAVDFANAHGVKVVYQGKYPSDTTDVSSIVSAIKAANPDIILNAGHLQDALLMQKGLKEQNVMAKAYGYSVGPDTPDFRKSLGNDANEVFGGAQWSVTVQYKGAPGFISTAPEYARLFKAKYGHEPDYHNAESTAACLAFQYALEKAGSLDPEAVRTALSNLDVVTFFGLLKFDSRGLDVYKPMVTNQIQNGNLYTVWPPAEAVKPAIYPAKPWGQR